MTVRSVSTIRNDIITAVDGNGGWKHSVTWLVHDEQNLDQRFKVEARDTVLPIEPGRRKTSEGLLMETRFEVTTSQRLKTGDPSDAYQDALNAQDTLRGLVLGAASGLPYHLLYDGTNRVPSGTDSTLRCVHRFTAKHRI